MSICKCGEFIGLIHKSCRRCGRKSIIYNEKGSRQCPLPLAPATNQSKEYHKFGSRQRPPPPAPETNPSKGDHKFGSRQRPPPPAPETNPSKDDHKFGSSQRRPPPAPETNPSKDDLEFGSEQRPPPPAPETNPSKDDHKFVSKQRPSPPAPDTNRSKDDHKFGSRPLPPTPKSETNESNDAHRYDLRDNPPKPVVNIQDSQSKEEYADDKSDGLVGRKSQMVDAGYITPMHMDSDEGDEIKINKGNRSESEHDQEPVYDEVGKDTYTTMSAGNSGIIPETSHELKLPTIRLNGPLQSPESLISQLDDSFKNEIRIVLIGKTGAGKSTTGNILLGKKEFSAVTSPVSVTKECCRAESDIHSKKLVVVDTPGLFDTELSPKEIQKEIIRCIRLSVPGPHIFLILLQVGRLTTEEIAALDQLFDIFGKNMSRFCMIVFTRIEDLEREGSTIDQFIIDGGPLLSGYIKKCSGRYFALKNPDSNEEQFQVSATFMGKINEVISKNKNECFTNLLYRDANESLHMSIKKVINDQNASNRDKIFQINTDYDPKIKELRSQNKHLDDELDHIKDRKRQLNSEREALQKVGGEQRINNEKFSKLELENNECYMRMSKLQRKKEESENQYEEIKTKKEQLLAKRAEDFKKELEAAAAMAILEQTQLMEPHFINILKKRQEIQELKTWFESGAHLSDGQMRKSFTDKERILRKQKERMEKQLEKKDKHLKQLMRNSMKLEDEFKRTKIKLCVVM